jgi:hypothetical protein
MDEEIKTHPVMLLKRSHDSFETAYEVKGYPYGGGRTCTKRYWVESNKRGQRLVTCTTNPRRGGIWNKPHAGTYSEMLWMYLDPENDHVETDGVGSYGTGLSPESHALRRLRGIYDQMPGGERQRYDALIEASKRADADSWAKWAWLLDTLAPELGGPMFPKPTNGVLWGRYVGDAYTIAVAWLNRGMVE